MTKSIRSAVLGLTILCSLTVGAQKNVTQRGDPIIASSTNSPATEGVANAIDGTTAKYLNFDSGRDGRQIVSPTNGFSPSGFVVSPSAGLTRVTGMSIQSADDSDERDPDVVLLEGSNDASVTSFNSGNWQAITTISNVATGFTARLQTLTFSFANPMSYRHYRWTVLRVRTTPNGCCMQVAEVTLLGAAAVEPLRELPVITQQPRSLIVETNSSAEFSVEASGTQPLAYQWTFNGDDIPDATSRIFLVNRVLHSQEGVYRVRISNTAGTVLSSHTGLQVVDVLGPPQNYDNDVILPPEGGGRADPRISASAVSAIAPYIPAVTDPIKTVCLNFHFFQKNDGSGNYQDTPQDYAKIKQMFDWVNGYYSMYPSSLSGYQPTYPCPGINYYFTHTRIQFSLANIYFYKNDALWSSSSSSALQNAAVAAHPTALKALNVYFTGGSYGGASGFAAVPSSNLAYDQFIVMLGINDNSLSYARSGTLAHELGHTLDLLHTYPDGCCAETCNPSDPDYLSDIFCPPTVSCLTPGGWACTTCINNMMGGTMDGSHFSALQIGKMHRALTIKSAKKYLADPLLGCPCVTPQWSWANRAGGNSIDSGNSVAVDLEGNVFVTGSYTGAMNFPASGVTLAGFGGNDIFLAKYNPIGALLWAVRAGGIGQDAGYGVAVDNSGNAYVTGEFTGSAVFETYPSTQVFTLSSLGGRDIFAAKYSPSGTCLWATRAGDKENDRGAGIAVTASGSAVFVTGNWSVSSSQVEAFVLKLSGSGALAAGPVITAGASGRSAQGRAIAVDPSGNAYVTGAYSGKTDFGTCTLPPTGAFTDIFAVKFTPALGCVWAHHSGDTTGNSPATGNHDGTGIAVDPAGTFFYLTAYFNGTANFGGGVAVSNTKANGLYDYLIAKFDLSGVPIWAIKGGGDSNADEETRGIAVDPDGHPCVIGFLRPNAPNPFVNDGPTVLVASYSSGGGMLRWTRNAIDGPISALPEDIGLGIAVDREGCVHVTGAFTQDLEFPPVGLPVATLNSIPANARDMFVAKMCPACSPLAVTINAAPGLVICAGQSTVLTANPTGGTAPYAYNWSGPGGATTGQTRLASLAGSYAVTVTDASGITATASSIVTVNPLPVVTVNSTTIPSGGSATLTATTGAASPTYLWSPGGETTASIIVSPASTTIYTVTVTDGVTHCSGTASGRVTVCVMAAIDCPADIVVDCRDGSGAFVTYSIPTPANKCCPGPVSVRCDPPPGLFPIGVTIVTCTATDSCGGSVQCSFQVVVRGHGPGEWNWAKRAGGDGLDTGNAVAVDNQGNVFVTGSYTSAINFPGSGVSLSGFGGTDVFLAKYTSHGVLIWAVRAGGPGQDAGYGVAVDAQGNAYVTGAFSGAASFDSISLTSAGGRDIFVAKYDPNGALLCAVQAGGAKDDFGFGIAVAGNGNVFVTGSWEISGAAQAFIMKVSGCNILGTFLSTGGSAIGRGIAVDAAGDVYVTGGYSGATSFGTSTVVAPAGFNRIFVAKFNGTPSVPICAWARHSSGGTASGQHDATGIAVSGNQCYVTAYFNGQADFGGGILVANAKASGLYDYLIAKFDLLGAPIWAIKGGGNLNADEETRGIAVDPDGHPCVTGFLRPGAINNQVNEGPTVLVASYSSAAGTLRWMRNATDGTAGSPLNAPEDVGLGIAVDRAGCVHVTGAFTQDLQFPPVGQPVATLNSIPATARDMFVAKMCPTCCVPAPANMVLWLPFDETTGTNSANLVPGGNNGKHVNGPVGTSGLVANSLTFDGTGQYVEVPNYTPINFGMNDFSVDAWISRATNDTVGTPRFLIDKRESVLQTGTGFRRGFTLLLEAGGQLAFQIGDGNSNPINHSSSLAVTNDGQWHHVAVTVDRENTNGIVFYLDGVVSSLFGNPVPYSGTVSTAVPLRVGSREPGLGGTFWGSIDEVELFNRVLAPAEIAEIFRAGSNGKCKTPCATPLVVNCPLARAESCGADWKFDFPTATSCCSSNVTIRSTGIATNGVCPKLVTQRWLITDECGNTAECSQTVTLTDTIAPIISTVPSGSNLGCNPANLPTDASVLLSVKAADNCSVPTINVSHVDLTTGCSVRRTFTITATDACQNTSSASTVNYSWTVDTTVPVISTSPSGSNLGCNPVNVPTDASIRLLVGATDNCGVTATNVSHVDISTGCSVRRIFTITATDACLNTSAASTVVYGWTVDTTPPVLTCATNKTVNCGTVWTFDAPTANDSCSGTNVIITILGTVTNGICPMVFTRTWQATDACGNTNTCGQTVTMVDGTPITLSVSAKANIFGAGQTTAPSPGGETGPSWSGVLPPSYNFSAGAGKVLTFSSISGQISSTTAGPFTGADGYNSFPTHINSYGGISGIINDRAFSLVGVFLDPIVPAMAPGILDFSASASPPGPGTSFPILPPEIGQTFYIGDGLTGTASGSVQQFVVPPTATRLFLGIADAFSYQGDPGWYGDNRDQLTVTFEVRESLICATNKTVECGTAWSFDPPPVWDTCNRTNVTVTVLSTVTNGICPMVITRTWQATDPCTNRFTCTQTVTVVDITPPVLTCATNKTVLCGTAWSFDPPSANDSCSGTNVPITIFQTLTNGVICPQVITRTWLATDACGNTNTCSQTVTLVECLPVCTPHTYTLDLDFDEGYSVNLNHTNVHDQLQVNDKTSPFPYVWIAASARGTVVKIDSATGTILGEYLSAPDGRGRDPSRTTVDKYGNCWVGNRAENTGGKGSVTRYSIVIGGTRVNAAGNPDPNGQYLKPPFLYNSGAVDRDGDGLIKTSRGSGDILSWSNLALADDNGGVSTAEDEAITIYIRTAGTGARSLAVDASNDLWVGGAENNAHEKYSGFNGATIAGTLFNNGYGGYGAVMDNNNVLWSARSGGGLLRLDATTILGAGEGNGQGDYGLSIDACTSNIWHTSAWDNTSWSGKVYVRNPAGVVIAGPYGHGDQRSQGVCVDQSGNVFVAHSVWGHSATTVGHIRTDGTFIGYVYLVWGTTNGVSPTGVAVGSDGKIWASCFDTDNVMRIDPNAGPVSSGFPVGAVDLAVDLNAFAYTPPPAQNVPAKPYNYSDQTGFVVLGATSPGGWWSVVRDGSLNGMDWGTVSWHSIEPAGTSIKVEVRADDNVVALPNKPWTEVSSGTSFCGSGITGRYLEVRASFLKANACAESPALLDLTVNCCLTTPCAPVNRRPSVICPGPFLFPNSTAPVTVTMNATFSDPDGDPLTVTWSEGSNPPYQIDSVPGGAPIATSAMLSFTHTFAPGIHVIVLAVTDSFGNRKVCDVIVKVGDHDRPMIAVPPGVSVADFTGVIPNFLTGLIASDDNTPPEQIVLTQTPRPGLVLSQGVQVIDLTARDLAGNTSTSQTFFAVSPVVKIISPINYETFTAPATVTVSASIASNVTGVATVRLLNGGAVVGAGSTAPYSFVVTNLPPGAYILTAQAESASNILSISKSVIISVMGEGKPASAAAITGLALNGGKISFSIQARPGSICHVEYTGALAPPSWVVLRTIVGDGSVVTVTDSATNAPRRFYRVRVE